MPVPLLASDLKETKKTGSYPIVNYGPGPKVTGPYPSVNFGPDSQALACPYCHAQISSKVKSKATFKTHLTALLLCLCLCWPCVCLPYCMKSCQNRNHMCPNCDTFLGTYEN